MGYRKGHSAMCGYSYKEFKKILATQGFFEHHRNSAHIVRKIIKSIKNNMINCLEPPISLSENPLCGFELRY